MNNNVTVNPKLDLVLERTSTLPAEQIWNAWTQPEILMKWFCPKPWKVTDCRIELFAGGEFFTVMEGTNNEKMPNSGCYLEIIPNKKIVWTGMMSKGFRPVPPDPMGFDFVATILLSKADSGTLYQAIVAHSTEEGKKKHEQMGFQEGWGMAFDQLETMYKL